MPPGPWQAWLKARREALVPGAGREQCSPAQLGPIEDDERTAAPDDPQQKASEHVGVRSGPGRPPASGSVEMGQRLSDPPTPGEPGVDEAIQD